MGEKRIVVDKLRVDFEGLFNFNELFNLIYLWLKDKGFGWREKYAHEKVTKDGKYVEVEIEASMELTDYIKSELRIHLISTELKETTVVKDNTKLKVNTGKIHFVIDGFMITDYEDKWDMKPHYYFIKTLFEKFAIGPHLGKYESKSMELATDLHQQVKSYLNLYRYGTPQTKPTGAKKNL